MKKSVLVIALALGVSSAFAQDLTSKKGEPMLPEAKDWAISMNVDPIFQYVGNAFSGATSTNSAPSANWVNGEHTIIGKQFIDEKSAYRVLVRLGFLSQTYKNNVNQNNPGTVTFPATAPIVTDKYKNSNTNIGIGVGKEWRRGKTRLQGFYGADVMIWITSSKQKYTYGNTMAVTSSAGNDPTPISTDWTNPSSPTSQGMGSRTTESKSGLMFGLGIRGFIGAEYFIFPKIAVGAEYGWGLGFQTKGKGKTTTETTGGSPTSVGTQTVETAGNSKFGIDTDINQQGVFGFHGSNSGSASLKVTFHF